jgi:hypothetical protein
MTGPAAHVTYFATPCNISGKAIEQVAVGGLVLKLVENSAGVLIRKPIVACTNRLCDVVIHSSARWFQHTRVLSGAGQAEPESTRIGRSYLNQLFVQIAFIVFIVGGTRINLMRRPVTRALRRSPLPGGDWITSVISSSRQMRLCYSARKAMKAVLARTRSSALPLWGATLCSSWASGPCFIRNEIFS